MNTAVLSPPAARPGDAATGPLPPAAGGLPPPVGDFRYTRFAPTLPSLEDGVEARRHPVAIAGGGPVGMALALGLVRERTGSLLLCIGGHMLVNLMSVSALLAG